MTSFVDKLTYLNLMTIIILYIKLVGVVDMDYIKRNIEETLKKAEKMFSSVLVTGARQVGKTTLLRKVKGDIKYLTLDDPFMLNTALDDAGSFFKNSPPPVIVDEIQYAPDLFKYIKMIADESRKKGQFYLTGSQQFHMMKNVSESLAGRIGIINLLGLSLREIQGVDFNKSFIPNDDYFKSRTETSKAIDYKKVWEIIHKGSMPAMYDENADWQMFYAMYTKTYIERDVKELTKVRDEQKFIKFMIALAARTSQMLNLTSVANDVGITVPTADRWLSILISSNIVYLLQPYHNNITKRTVKTPKLYFLDTGLATYLTRWTTPEVLEAGAMSGAFFETFVVAEVLKSYYNAGILVPPLYYYRDKDKKEIDIIIDQDNTLYPIEVKKSNSPKKEFVKNFSVLTKIAGKQIGMGAVICLYDNIINLDKDTIIVPINFL